MTEKQESQRKKTISKEEREWAKIVSLDIEIAQCFHELQVPLIMKGYRYLWFAIQFVGEYPKYTYSELCSAVAERCGGTNAVKVKLEIRKTINFVWKRLSDEKVKRIFGLLREERAPKSEKLIRLLSNYVSG